jgi:hypothetical protein
MDWIQHAVRIEKGRFQEDENRNSTSVSLGMKSALGKKIGPNSLLNTK